MKELQEQIELPPDQRAGNAATTSEGSPKVQPAINPSFIGHPKLTKLKEIVLDHFRSHSENGEDHKTDSRIMIFSQYRDSVQEIAGMFSTCKPLVRVMSFIGQQSRTSTSKGFTQKEQLEVTMETIFTSAKVVPRELNNVDSTLKRRYPRRPRALVRR